MKKNDAIIAVILGLVIPLCLTIMSLLGIDTDNTLRACWPGFFVVLLFLIGKEKTFRDCLNIVVSGIVGIVWSYLGSLLVPCFMGSMPPIAATALGVGIMVFGFAFLMGLLPTFFNNYGFLYFMVASLMPVQETVVWSCSTVLMGALFMLLVFGGIRLFCGFDSIKLTMKPGAELSDSEKPESN
ncbi:MAG: hypothetical protein ACOX1O_04640 [Eggerthellaceae bacterium]|jgi:hypothetical protein